MRGAAHGAQPDSAMTQNGPHVEHAARFAWGAAYCLSDAISTTNRYFTSLFSIRS